ncbi:CDK6 [Cordylochernes scorpioides]|uniref:CDK6 n=1 Tax=Cordylochernes scorpioides TaxID=51811 RepID=A0ABY6KBL1_9ARAC|nr:CDK6 [Cordylochernes scorpioides]
MISSSYLTHSVISVQMPAPAALEERYSDLVEIGTGAYGTVYRAHYGNGLVALKKVLIPQGDDGIPVSTLREISFLRQLASYDHPNIVKAMCVCHRFLDIVHGAPETRHFVIFLIFEHMDQDLSTYLARCPEPGLDQSCIRDIMRQVLQGLDFLHTHRIVHRDIKPQNILVSQNGSTVKLADFGLARIYDYLKTITAVVT